MTDLALQKAELRKNILEKRAALTAEEVTSLSNKIQERFLSSIPWKGNEKIGLYSPVRNEVDTTLVFMKALEKGLSVYFPRVEQGLNFYEVSDPAQLERGAWGIKEPKHGCLQLSNLAELNILIIPGLIFDRRGYRLGYGKAFYDTILDSALHIPTIGLAYDFQIVDELPVEPWDRTVQKILTEKGWLPLKNS
jgi:5-formyltetrahydrofolate cyclo-ligase